jgi:hypothetical protein
MNKPLIYLGCALTNAPKDFLEYIKYLREQISPYGEVLDFLGLHHPSVGDAFQFDLNCVRRCDLMIGDLTYPSLGLGMELGVAVENRKPIITIANDKLAAERLLMWGYWDPLCFKLRYKSPEEAADFIVAKIIELFPWVGVDKPLPLARMNGRT